MVVRWRGRVHALGRSGCARCASGLRDELSHTLADRREFLGAVRASLVGGEGAVADRPTLPLLKRVVALNLVHDFVYHSVAVQYGVAVHGGVLASVAIRPSMLCFGTPRMLRERVSGPGAAPRWAVRAVAGGYDVMTRVRGLRQTRATVILRAVQTRVLRWTTPATRTPVRGAIADVTMSTAALVAENARRRQQLIVLQRSGTSPAFTPRDRVALVLLARLVRGWRAALLIVQPDTLLRWQRHGDRLVWRVRSATALKRPPVSAATVALIKRMAEENRLGGAERLRGDLLTLGVRVGTRTVQRHRRGVRPTRPTRPRGQTWATFLHHHAAAVWACDVLPRSDVGFRALVAFFSVDLGARRVVHVGVTRHPTDAWVAPQWREATPFGMSPRFVIRDNDATCGAQFARVAARSRIAVVRTPVPGTARTPSARGFWGASGAHASITCSSSMSVSCSMSCARPAPTSRQRDRTRE